jgi:uncharacterized delta-60 repeat protein
MRSVLACLFLILSACGGGGQPPGTPPSPPAPPPSGIGTSGGTVSNGGASVVVPAGALTQNVQIAIEQTNAGAPVLPQGVVTFGPMFAFTPHGTQFASPATVTLPYDPSLVPANTQLQLYKTDSTQTAWVSVALMSTGSNSVTAQITGFSHLVVGGTPPPPLEAGEPVRAWGFQEYLADGLGPIFPDDQIGKHNSQTGGVVEETYEYGPLSFDFSGDMTATGEVFSSATGGTYWVYAEAPQGSILDPLSTIGSRVSLVQRQGFKKKREDARLKLKVTKIFMRAIDANGSEILYPECPWGLGGEECGLTIAGVVTFQVNAFTIGSFFSGAGIAELYGFQGKWHGRTRPLVKGSKTMQLVEQPLWNDSQFELDEDVGGFGAKQHATYQLKEPLVIEIDISKLNLEQEFTLSVEAVAETTNRRQRESYVAAFFRDPVGIEGGEIETFGLEAVPVPYDEPQDEPPQVPECTSADEEEGGTLQFSAATYFAPEVPNGGRQVTITRTGGSRGIVGATLRTHDGTALEPDDYAAVNTTVYFGDGDDEPRVLDLPLKLDLAPEIDESLTLTLSDPQGCAVLGEQTETTLTIQDDDRPEPEPPPSGLDETFGDGGKASAERFGGDNSGMALQADGNIVMVGGRFIDFVLARFNADGSLDTSFGTGGKVTTDIAGGFAQERARAVAIQSDGKIVVAGEASLPSGDLAVAIVRYNTDGTLDDKFGAGGKAFNAPAVKGRAFDVAIQPDGRIVIVGDAPLTNATQDFGDFLIARYTTGGVLDATFGISGQVVEDMSSGTDLARNVVVQPNGAIVVSGDPIGTDPSLRTSVARFNANGTFDTTFNGAGKLVLAGAHVGRGLAVQPDGRILLAGSMGVNNVPNDFTHFCLIRLNADGTFDNSFGSGGTITTSLTGLTDVAHAVTLQADGKIVAAGEGNLVNPNFALARYNTNGSLDTSFAVDGKLVVDFFGFEDRAENVAVQADGKIVAGGLAHQVTDGYGLVRVNP